MSNETNHSPDTSPLIPALTAHKGEMLWGSLNQRGSIAIQTKGEALASMANIWRNGKLEKELIEQTVVIEYSLMTSKG